MNKKVLFALSAMVALLLMPFAASASVVPLSVEQMTAVADDVVTVRVTGKKSEVWERLLVTRVDFNVLEAHKGQMSGKGQLYQLGGQVGRFVMDVPGQPIFREGQEAVLFLSKPVSRLPAAQRDSYNSESPLVKNPQLIGGFQGRLMLFDPAAPIDDEGVSQRTASEPVPGNLRVSRLVHDRVAPSLSAAPTYEDFRIALRDTLARSAEQRRTKNLQEIKGIRGEFAVAERTATPALRSLDPLPGVAYMTDEQLDELNRQVWEAASPSASANTRPTLQDDKSADMKAGK